MSVVAHPKHRETLHPIYLRIDPEKIVELKNVLESYDFLGLIRTLNRDRGEIVILTVDDVLPDLEPLLESLRAEIGFTVIPPPESICEDWLLAESYPDRHPSEASSDSPPSDE